MWGLVLVGAGILRSSCKWGCGTCINLVGDDVIAEANAVAADSGVETNDEFGNLVLLFAAQSTPVTWGISS